MVEQVPVITLLAIISVAHADVSHLNGYQYNNLGLTHTLKLHTADSPAPTQYHGSYGDETGQSLPNSYVPPPSGSPFDSASPLQRTYTAPRLSAPLQSPVYAAQMYQQNQQTQQNYQQYQQARSYQTQPSASNTYQTQAALTSNTYQTQAAPTYSQAQQANGYSQEPIVTKHFYVHAAPEDPEEEVGPRFVQVGPKKINYKIIFIKTPTYGLKSQIIPILPPSLDKTIVYVLSKKPTFDQNVQIPEQPVTEPSKPDVFFIKYKTQQEADQAQQSIQGNP